MLQKLCKQSFDKKTEEFSKAEKFTKKDANEQVHVEELKKPREDHGLEEEKQESRL
jgi:hypothetical protein